MKQSTYKKLFKRFWILFLVPNLYGMEYGVVKHNINECCYGKTSGEQTFVKVTKDALGIKNIHSPQEAIDTMGELFDAFNPNYGIKSLKTEKKRLSSKKKK